MFIHLSTILLFLLQIVKGRLFLGLLPEKWDLEVNAVKLAGIDFAPANSDSLAVFDFVAQEGNFLFHSANNANFHRFTRDVSGLVA